MIFAKSELSVSRSETFPVSVSELFRMAVTYPLFVKAYDVKEILSETPSELRVRMGRTIWGLPFRWEGTGQKKKDDWIHFTQTRGLLKGLTAEWTFREMAAYSTRLQIVTRFTCRALFRGFFYGLVVSTMDIVFQELAAASSSRSAPAQNMNIKSKGGKKA